MKILEMLKKLNEKALKDIKACTKELGLLKSKILGKKGLFGEINQMMKSLPIEEKKALGKESNIVKTELAKALEAKRVELEEKNLEEKLSKEKIDVTLGGVDVNQGTQHILDKVISDAEELFVSLGYVIKNGPIIETDVNNFEKLNLPKNHPARDMQDSFYINASTLLRTHTSPTQVREMMKTDGEDIKIICPGVVFRRDEDDATHSHQFMQIEGLVIGENITMSDLKGTLNLFIKRMFGEEKVIRLRPSYFPFTEPSVEVDVSCTSCNGKGCRICKNTGWIEILGAGMVHRNVLESCGIDSEKYQGFAFGIGVERIAMLKYNIDDIRRFYTNDMRFINNFKGVR